MKTRESYPRESKRTTRDNEVRSFLRGQEGVECAPRKGAPWTGNADVLTVEHKHPGNRCPKPSVTAEGYCQECHDKAVKEDTRKKP